MHSNISSIIQEQVEITSPEKPMNIPFDDFDLFGIDSSMFRPKINIDKSNESDKSNVKAKAAGMMGSVGVMGALTLLANEQLISGITIFAIGFAIHDSLVLIIVSMIAGIIYACIQNLDKRLSIGFLAAYMMILAFNNPMAGIVGLALPLSMMYRLYLKNKDNTKNKPENRSENKSKEETYEDTDSKIKVE